MVGGETCLYDVNMPKGYYINCTFIWKKIYNTECNIKILGVSKLFLKVSLSFVRLRDYLWQNPTPADKKGLFQ